jgi:hypothetical protein
VILAAHQPDLLPYTGFWHKMENADVFCVLPYEQINHDGFTRRVKMAGKWATLATKERRMGQRINELELQEDAGFRLWNVIAGRYRTTPHWSARQSLVADWVRQAASSRHMWQFNLSLILSVRDYLQIRTPVTVPVPASRECGDATDKLMELARSTRCDEYLCGSGATNYMRWHTATDGSDGESYLGDVPTDPWEPVKVRFSKHQAWSYDSILSTIFEKDDPMEWVLNKLPMEASVVGGGGDLK